MNQGKVFTTETRRHRDNQNRKLYEKTRVNSFLDKILANNSNNYLISDVSLCLRGSVAVGSGMKEYAGGTVIIGMGNRLLSDDGVGIAVAFAVARRLKHRVDLSVTELHTGGLRLMEAMTGFKQAVVVDAMQSGARPGTLRCFDPDDFVTTKNTFSSHDTDFATAFDLGRMAGILLPDRVSFWGIEARECALFGQRFSDEVSAALPGAVDRIVAQIAQWETAA